LLHADPDVAKQSEAVNAADSLRRRLVTLREEEIKTAFPDVPPESGLLRKSMLDELIRKHPRTKDEWFSRISTKMRSRTDSKQVAQFLPKVLEILTGEGE
jgi:hypothetical protein